MNKKQIEEILKGMTLVKPPVNPFSIHTERLRNEKGEKVGTKIVHLKDKTVVHTKKTNQEIGNEDIQMPE